MLFLVDHSNSITALRSSCSFAQSAATSIFMDSRVSSAKHLIIQCIIHSPISLINIINNIGPSTVP